MALLFVLLPVCQAQLFGDVADDSASEYAEAVTMFGEGEGVGAGVGAGVGLLVRDAAVPFWPYVFARLLIVLYCLICFLSLLSIIRILCHHHKLFSFRFFFLLLSLLWILLRICFFLSPPGGADTCTPSHSLSDSIESDCTQSWLSHFIIDLLYYLPGSCQLAMFSLLLVFYAKLYHQHTYTWKAVRQRCILAFSILNVSMFVITILFICVIQSSTLSTPTLELYHQLYFICCATFFLVLFCIALVYGQRLYYATSLRATLASHHHLSLSMFIFLLLLSRCIFDAGAALDAGGRWFRKQLYESRSGVLIDGSTFILLVVWEILPTLLVIVYFHDTPHYAEFTHTHTQQQTDADNTVAQTCRHILGYCCCCCCPSWVQPISSSTSSASSSTSLLSSAFGASSFRPSASTFASTYQQHPHPYALNEEDDEEDAFYYDDHNNHDGVQSHVGQHANNNNHNTQVTNEPHTVLYDDEHYDATTASVSSSALLGEGEDDGGLRLSVVDVPYWEAVLSELSLYKALACLSEFYSDLLRRQAVQLRHDDDGDKGKQQHADTHNGQDKASGIRITTSDTASNLNVDHAYSPRLFSFDEELDWPVITEEQDAAQLQAQRQQVQMQHPTALLALSDTSATAALPASSADESTLEHNEISLPHTFYHWHSKYRPRKPRYFNRVKTGYEWNKYNQTHYDKENPPPKIVQGYKFHIFYPDLIDPHNPQSTPGYRIERDVENDEYCVIRFHAGPPYEDVAFKIVNKEWEYGPRRGFKCIFDKGVLQLYFNFKRYFYRR